MSGDDINVNSENKLPGIKIYSEAVKGTLMRKPCTFILSYKLV
jgi:hypothetical protein